LAPKDKADYAFVTHMLYHLAEDGIMAVVLPHGVLFRGGAEGKIRRAIIEKFNYLDAVIGLPPNLFYGTSIPACVLVFKKCREHDDILFIDASKEYEKGKNKNYLLDEHIEKIITTYRERKEIDKFSHLATLFEGEWVEKRLGDLCNTFSGGTPDTTNKNYWNGDIPFIKSGEINNKITSQKISELGLKNSSAKLVKKGDLLLALYGATSGEVAISKLKGAINQAVLCIRCKKVKEIFLYHLLFYNKLKIISKYTQGGQPNLSAKIIKSIKIHIPPTLAEQQKIADFLSLIDEKIQLQSQKIEKLENYKKGLMQKLLTGELRFPEFKVMNNQLNIL